MEGSIMHMLGLRAARLMHGGGGASESWEVVVVVVKSPGASDDSIVIIIGELQLIQYWLLEIVALVLTVLS